ncbi:hypothetical protein NP233_g4291 [Leucocoprinus birnbaumii]|uniref:F-box domain-containing protein n=1 Tax=Leucocoprinus birnbaumii TaxID=56174 RepID=A0AAD5VUX1_9AGAR|nr:hypothetical protein NP233_g4291 [Leucocoprinus birnbaumii]
MTSSFGDGISLCYGVTSVRLREATPKLLLLPSTTPAYYAGMNTPLGDECRFIESTITRISAEIDALFRQKANLSQRLNTLRAHPSVLPPETLATIFEYVSGAAVHERSTVASVCSHWHHVVHSTPSLWTSVTASLRQNRGVERMDYYREKAQGMPLSVTLHGWSLYTFQGHAPIPHQEHDYPIMRVLLVSMPRSLRLLEINCVNPFIWSLIEKYSSDSQGFSQLEELKLSFSFHHSKMGSSSTPLFPGSRLTSVKLRGRATLLVNMETRVQLDHVTRYEEGSDSVLHGMKGLLRFPSIRSFKWSSTRQPGIPEIVGPDIQLPNLTSQVSLPSLKTLLWSCTDASSATRVMQYIRLPSLQNLDWQEKEHQSESNSDFPNARHAFFSSMSQLHTVRLFFGSDTPELLSCVPSVESLEIKYAGGPAGMLEPFFRQMVISAGTNRLLPRLRDMTMQFSTLTSLAELDALVDMLVARSGHLLSGDSCLKDFSFHSRALSPITSVLHENHVGILKQLINDGLKFEIWEHRYRPSRKFSL